MSDKSGDSFEELFEQFFMYLDGDGERPDLSDVPDEIVNELRAIESATRMTADVDVEMIPDFEEDPVAVALGFRSGPEERRVSGPAIARARRRLELSPEQLAARLCSLGHTVGRSDVETWERAPWATINSSLAEALAGILGVDERDLRVATKSFADEVGETLSGLDLPLVVDPDADPVGDWASGRRSSLVVGYLDLRIRVVLLDDLFLVETLRSVEVIRVAKSILRSAAETSAVAIVLADAENTTQIVEPMDVSETIVAPTGQVSRGVPFHVPLPLELAFKEFFERMVPRWEALLDTTAVTEPADWAEISMPFARAAISNLASKRFKIDEKKTAYQTLSADDAESIVEIVARVAGGLSGDPLLRLIEEKAELVS